MGRYPKTRADTLRRRENKGRNKVWQILDDTQGSRFTKLGKCGKSSYANAEKKSLP